MATISAILIHGDGGKMSEVADSESQLVVTSPPYFPDPLEPVLRKGGISLSDAREIAVDVASFAWSLRSVFEECSRILHGDGVLVMQTRDVRIGRQIVAVEGIHRSLLENTGFVLVSRHLWRPSFTTRARRSKLASDKVLGFPQPLDKEVFLVFVKEGADTHFQCLEADAEMLSADVVVSHKGRLSKSHRFQAPLPLIEAFVRTFSQPDDLVVDPFAGGATALVAASRQGRRALGYEIDLQPHRSGLCNLEELSYDR